jgi:hypothetical protein
MIYSAGMGSARSGMAMSSPTNFNNSDIQMPPLRSPAVMPGECATGLLQKRNPNRIANSAAMRATATQKPMLTGS